MSQSQSGKKDDSKALQLTTDRRPLVSCRTSPLIRVRFRNPIRLSLTGSSSASSRTTEASSKAGAAGCDRRRRSVDSASMTSETTASEMGKPVTTDDLGLVPRVHQYEKHELLQERSPESGLSEVEAFLLEKQRLMELASADGGGGGDNDDGDDDKDKLVPRAPHYVPHPILQVKTETGLTELELYFQQKEAQLEQAADDKVDQHPVADVTTS